MVIPVHGDSPFLAAAVLSALHQETPTELEVVTVLDRPGDGAVRFLRECLRTFPSLKVIESDHQGISMTMNTGVRAAKYAHIARLDQDDVLTEGSLHVRQRALVADPTLVAVGGQVLCIDARDQFIGHWSYPTAKAAVRTALRVDSAVSSSGSLFLREAFVRVGGFRPQLDLAEDYDLWLRLLDVGEIANVPVAVVKYRMHSAQATRTRHFEQLMAAALAQQSARRRRSGKTPDIPLTSAGKVKATVRQKVWREAKCRQLGTKRGQSWADGRYVEAVALGLVETVTAPATVLDKFRRHVVGRNP